MRSRGSVYFRWLVVFGFAALIYYCSSRPAWEVIPPLFPHFDKVLHFISYGIFAMLIFRALWADDTRPASTGVLLLGVSLAMIYGVSDEFHQAFVPGREFSWLDMAANGAGAAVAAALWEVLTAFFPWLK